MLVEFSVTNYRSIKSEQTLSMVASSKSDKNHFELTSPNSTKLLRTAVIYGPNAAGKSNIIKAMIRMNDIVLKSASIQEGDLLLLTPFLFDKESREEPSEFEVIFIVDGVRYQYGFVAFNDRVLEEWLIAYPKGRAQRWFTRVYDEVHNTYEYKYSEHLAGQKNIWQTSTRSNALFLSTAVQLNSSQLKPIFNWFKDKFIPTDIGGWGNGFSTENCINADTKHKIVNFLKSTDTDIKDIRVKKSKFDVNTLSEKIPENFREKIIKELADKDVYDIETMHFTSDGGSVYLDLEDESDGTKRIFSFAGPIIDTIEDGNILIIDELHDNLHPKIVKFIVDLFNNELTNPNNAQLIFTTHETSILNEEVFTPDQVWFCEKNKNQESMLFPLSDFNPRKGRSNLEFSYLSGRYGAIPFVTPFNVGA